MDPLRLLQLHARACDCLDRALASHAAGRPEHIDLPIRTAREILSYIETKLALETDLTSGPIAAPDDSSIPTTTTKKEKTETKAPAPFTGKGASAGA